MLYLKKYAILITINKIFLSFYDNKKLILFKKNKMISKNYNIRIQIFILFPSKSILQKEKKNGNERRKETLTLPVRPRD